MAHQVEHRLRTSVPNFWFAVEGTCAWRGHEEAFSIPLPAEQSDHACTIARQFLRVLFTGVDLPRISIQATRRLGDV